MGAIGPIYRRYKAQRVAAGLAGIWTVWNYKDRELIPRPGDSVTVITPRSWWSSPYILDVYARDLREGREHLGYIVIDSECPTRAVRTIYYQDSGETTQQNIEIGHDTFTVFQTQRGYENHVLRRSGLLGLN